MLRIRSQRSLHKSRLELGPQQKTIFCLVSGKETDPQNPPRQKKRKEKGELILGKNCTYGVVPFKQPPQKKMVVSLRLGTNKGSLKKDTHPEEYACPMVINRAPVTIGANSQQGQLGPSVPVGCRFWAFALFWVSQPQHGNKKDGLCICLPCGVCSRPVKRRAQAGTPKFMPWKRIEGRPSGMARDLDLKGMLQEAKLNVPCGHGSKSRTPVNIPIITKTD